MLAIFDALGPRYAVSFLAWILEGDEGVDAVKLIVSLEIRTFMNFFERYVQNHIYIYI